MLLAWRHVWYPRTHTELHSSLLQLHSNQHNKILLYFPVQSPQAKACVRRGFLPSKSEQWNLWLQLWETARKQIKGSGYVNSHSCSLLLSPDPALQHPRGAHPSLCAHSTARGQRCSSAGKLQLSSPALLPLLLPHSTAPLGFEVTAGHSLGCQSKALQKHGSSKCCTSATPPTAHGT